MGSHLCYSIMKTLLFCTILATLAFYSLASVGEERNYITCLLCKDLVQVVDDAILSNNTISQIEETLDGICSIAGNLQEVCEGFINSNLENVIDLLVNFLNPYEVCTQLHACDVKKMTSIF